MSPECGWTRVFIFCAILALDVKAYREPRKFLIATNPQKGVISYMRVGTEPARMRTLIDTGLVHPQGIAVDQKRMQLIVADPSLKQVVAYELKVEDDDVVAEPDRLIVANNVEARWVAVDGQGSVFFTDEANNMVLRVSAQQILDGDTRAQVIYTGTASSAPVSSPGGVAVDNFNVFWTNKLRGPEIGTVIRAMEQPRQVAQEQGTTDNIISALATNSPKSYGVCVAMDNVIYTDDQDAIYVVKREGNAPPTVLSTELQRPRGCAWDGDGSIYVADRKNGAIYGFREPSVSLAQEAAKKIVDFEDAFGVAVLSSSRGAASPLGVMVMLCVLGVLRS